MAFCAPSTFPALLQTKFSGFGALSGWRSFFEAGFEKDPHGPRTAGIAVHLKNSPTPQITKVFDIYSLDFLGLFLILLY